MSVSVYMWVIGGFVALMGVFTKVAYSDPSFYTEFLEKIINKVSFCIFICSGSLWLGLSIGHSYAAKKLGLSPEQLTRYSTDYDNFTSPIILVYWLSILAFFYSFFLVFVAEKKRVPTK